MKMCSANLLTTLTFAVLLNLGLTLQALAAPDCNHIAASPNPSQNYDAINFCWSSPKAAAYLEAGIFPLPKKLIMPPKAKLIGSGGDNKTSTLVAAPMSNQPWSQALAQRYPNNTVLEISDDNIVKNLRITGNGQLHADCCTTIIAISGSRSQLSAIEVFDLDPQSNDAPKHPGNGKPTGIYFIGLNDSKANLVDKASIHHVNLGVIFRSGLPVQQANTLLNSELFMLSCDGITFAGYGIAKNNSLHDVGFDCGQRPTPIAGAGIYAQNNSVGAEIVGNTITDVCGNGLDIVKSQNFTIVANKIHQDGPPLHGKYAYCVGGSPGSFMDISHFTITNNSFSAIDTPPLGPFLDLFPVYAAGTYREYLPLPNKSKQVMAVRIIQHEGAVVSNIIDHNRMVSRCKSLNSCEGIGLYLGPGTGMANNGKAQSAAVNSLRSNSFVGSNIEFLSCGADGYSGDGACKKLKTKN